MVSPRSGASSELKLVKKRGARDDFVVFFLFFAGVRREYMKENFGLLYFSFPFSRGDCLFGFFIFVRRFLYGPSRRRDVSLSVRA